MSTVEEEPPAPAPATSEVPDPKEQDLQQQPQQLKEEKKSSTFSFSIWPPSQRTRDAVIQRLIETLSTPSVLSNRYGTLSSEEASNVAPVIEEEAFAVSSRTDVSDEDGMKTLQFYSKEISKRMLELVKSRSAASAPPSLPEIAETPVVSEDSTITTAAKEEVPPMESDSPKN